MKKIIYVLLLVSTLAIANDHLDIKVTQDINFDDGFGMLQAQPILKGVKDIQLIGQYNVNPQNGNVEMKFDKVIYRDQTYTLTEPFVKQARLKNPKSAVLKKDSRIKIAGGSKSEILNILNNTSEGGSASARNGANGNKTGTSGNQIGGVASGSNTNNRSNNTGYGSSSNGTNGYNAYNPAYSNLPYLGSGVDLTSGSSNAKPNFASATTNDDGSCKSPYVKDGVVGVYVSVAGSCKLFTAPESAIYIKENQATCQNKIDYVDKTVQIGQEKYIAMDDNKEYKISQCEYSKPITLSSEIGKCKAIPDYTENKALIQRQYFYIKDNQRVDVGNCTPTNEKISMLDDTNQCDYRLDFVNKTAIKQTQFFYIADNKKYNVGECVDKKGEKFQYPMYETPSNCPFTTLTSGEKIYQTKLVFNDLNNSIHNATDCRLIDTQGIKVFEEFAGYNYKDTSKQAIRKINQYFIGVGNRKIYLAKDVETNKSYPYESETCEWVNDDVKMVSTMKLAMYFQDTDENKKVYMQKCNDPKNFNEVKIAYVPLHSRGKLIDTQKNKTLIPENGKLKIYGTSSFIENTGIPNNNISGFSDVAFRDTLNVDIKNYCINGWATASSSQGAISTYYESYKGIKSLYSTEQIAGLTFSKGTNGKYNSVNNNNGHHTVANNGTNCIWKTKIGYFTNQTISEYEVQATYLRGDGSKLELPNGEIKYYAQ